MREFQQVKVRKVQINFILFKIVSIQLKWRNKYTYIKSEGTFIKDRAVEYLELKGFPVFGWIEEKKGFTLLISNNQKPELPRIFKGFF